MLAVGGGTFGYRGALFVVPLSISHDWGKNVGIDDPPVLVEGDHGGHVLQRGGGRRGHLVVRHCRPGQRDIQLLPGREEGLKCQRRQSNLKQPSILRGIFKSFAPTFKFGTKLAYAPAATRTFLARTVGLSLSSNFNTNAPSSSAREMLVTAPLKIRHPCWWANFL